MQLVSRDILFDVASKIHPVQLVESETPAFQEFCKKATTEYDKANSKYLDGKSKVNEMEMFSNAMLRFMNDNKSQIRYVGQGSSRIVFAMADGTALKLAKTRAGISQNRQEAKACMNSKMKYEIFPDFYGADRKKWLALNCELCAKAERQDFKELFMAQPIVVSELIEFVFKVPWESGQTLDQILLKTKDFYAVTQPNPVKEQLLKRLVQPKTLAEKALRSLFDFYDNYSLDELLVGDLESIENWGISIRDGQKVLVIIDAGFSEDVWQQHYNQN